MINETFALWGGFTLFILAMLALDLGVFQRKPRTISIYEALGWFGVWTGMALIFNFGIILFHERGAEAGMEFFTGFLVEKALSVDNLFVFLLIFGFFKVPQTYQHKVLFWGIIGAIVMRIAFILGGLALLDLFHWMIYVFGGFLLFTGITMMRKKDDALADLENNRVIRLAKRLLPVTDKYDGSKFWTRVGGKWMVTPLFIVLLVVESSDILFAVDSIPAIFAVTNDPFIIYTSNIFAILGLRALYFAVAGFMRMFHFLHYGLASIIIALGIKMLVSDVYKVPVAFSLVLIMVILLVCVIVSLMRPRSDDLKMMFERPERLGLMPFRQLLLIENIVDMSKATVKEAMHPRGGVRCVQLDKSWEENVHLMRETRYSRFPITQDGHSKPFGVLHVKDLILTDPGEVPSTHTLQRLARPCLDLKESLPLDDALNEFQRASSHFAVVSDENEQWSGIITFEDVLEELVGKIGDEFDAHRGDQLHSLSDGFLPERVVFGLEGATLGSAIQYMIKQVPETALPTDRQTILEALAKLGDSMSIYLSHGLAILHCQLPNLEGPALFFGRSEDGIALENSDDRIGLVFILLTPDHLAREQPRLLADIVGVLDSDYVTERFTKAANAEQVVVALRDGLQVVLD